MPTNTTLYKIITAIIGVTLFLLVIDFLFFSSRNLTAVITSIIGYYYQNPIASWGATLIILFIPSILIVTLMKRRRDFLKRLKDKIASAERITLIELARGINETPAKVEVELRRMASSKVRRLPGILMVSRGKHVYLGERLLNKITNLYNEGLTRGEIAAQLQIPRDEVDKAIVYLADEGVIQEREETKPVKMKPSYRRGTR